MIAKNLKKPFVTRLMVSHATLDSTYQIFEIYGSRLGEVIEVKARKLERHQIVSSITLKHVSQYFYQQK